ncbi:right-handed parallel beta-helix repeat-containing protein [Portibacter lacus]|uniref:Pectate lyase n=1 Tax=Portibacter lacus TaxID=1099794 RepID=A0AA37WG94_9BACT|nr:T9SS type A sorting domain-containing protein [Portibacter lacus]GLR19603.1 pectate lyase [Portibacter lacus]
MKSLFSLLLFILLGTTSIFSQIYVAADGDDANPGSISQPLESIQKAQELASPGDTVFIRGGLYQVREDQVSKIQQDLFACVSSLDKSGLPGQTIKYWAYPGETPIFDFSDVALADHRMVGIWVDRGTEYIHIKGLEMTGMQVTITSHTESYCIYSQGDNNIFEAISMHDNIGTALRHFRGGNNLFLNCDAYRNHDNVSEDGKGSNTDGFGCHPNPGSTGNVFRGCRAWFNSDDGFDIIRADEAVLFENCWAFYNGFSSDFQSLGDGNGFKAGGYAYDTADKIPNPVPRNTVRFCIAVRNKASGFYSNHHLAGNDWYNNSAYLNNSNFNMVNRESPESDDIWVDGYDHVLKNNLSYKPYGFGSHTAYIDTTQNTSEYNSFSLPITLTDDDFISLDHSLLTSPRNSDGSLPAIDFMRPSEGSAINDAGVDIGFPFYGNAPDLGAIETNYLSSIETLEEKVNDKIALLKNYPNPFNSLTNFHYTLTESGNIDLSIYNISGQKIRTLTKQFQSAGTFTVSWNGENDFGQSVDAGLYFYRLNISNSTGSQSIQKKVMRLK